MTGGFLSVWLHWIAKRASRCARIRATTERIRLNPVHLPWGAFRAPLCLHRVPLWFKHQSLVCAEKVGPRFLSLQGLELPLPTTDYVPFLEALPTLYPYYKAIGRITVDFFSPGPVNDVNGPCRRGSLNPQESDHLAAVSGSDTSIFGVYTVDKPTTDVCVPRFAHKTGLGSTCQDVDRLRLLADRRRTL